MGKIDVEQGFVMRKNIWNGNPPEVGELVAESRGYRLFVISASGDWQQLKLVSKLPAAKANFWLAWNGQRQAMGKDAVILNAHYPDVFDWVNQEMLANDQ